jgi:hypothetical protein
MREKGTALMQQLDTAPVLEKMPPRRMPAVRAETGQRGGILDFLAGREGVSTLKESTKRFCSAPQMQLDAQKSSALL